MSLTQIICEIHVFLNPGHLPLISPIYLLEVQLFSKPITSTAPHHRIEKIPAITGRLLVITGKVPVFTWL